MQEEDRERLVRIETKLDEALERQDDHETRLRGAEHKLWATIGSLPIVGSLIGAFLYKLH